MKLLLVCFTFVLVVVVQNFLALANGQLKFQFPVSQTFATRPSSSGQGQGQAGQPSMDFGGKLTFETPRPRPVLQGTISGPGPAPVTPVLIWGVLESKSSTNSTGTGGEVAATTREGPSCPDRFKLQCAPKQDCVGRPGNENLPDQKDPRIDSGAGKPVPVTVPVVLAWKDGTPRIVNIPPQGVVCKQDEFYCCAPVRDPPPTTPAPPPPVKCGLSYTIPIPDYKLSYGQAAFGQYPWTAVIYTQDGSVAMGVLIDDRHVLTVAHKIGDDGRKPVKVVFGEWDIGIQLPEPYGRVEVTVANYKRHDKFGPVSLHHDIALITLSRPLELHKYQHIRPVCSPNLKKNYVGQRCWVAGFGKNAFKSNALSPILKEVDLPVMDDTECQERLRKSQLGPFFNLNEGDHGSFLCAGGAEPGKDTCAGDGGAPLVCKNAETGQFEAVGLVSWGVGCGQPGIPSVFVNLANYIDWIQEKSKW